MYWSLLLFSAKLNFGIRFAIVPCTSPYFPASFTTRSITAVNREAASSLCKVVSNSGYFSVRFLFASSISSFTLLVSASFSFCPERIFIAISGATLSIIWRISLPTWLSSHPSVTPNACNTLALISLALSSGIPIWANRLLMLSFAASSVVLSLLMSPKIFSISFLRFSVVVVMSRLMSKAFLRAVALSAPPAIRPAAALSMLSYVSLDLISASFSSLYVPLSESFSCDILFDCCSRLSSSARYFKRSLWLSLSSAFITRLL